MLKEIARNREDRKMKDKIVITIWALSFIITGALLGLSLFGCDPVENAEYDPETDADTDASAPDSTWVLRDKDDQVIEGEFEPYIDNDGSVFVREITGTELALYFDLETGSVVYSMYESDDIAFLNNQCSGLIYAHFEGTYFVNEGLHQTIDSVISPIYFWERIAGECTTVYNASEIEIWETELVPEWNQGVLQAPPYTLTLEPNSTL